MGQLEPEQSKLPSSSKMIESKSQKQDKISQSQPTQKSTESKEKISKLKSTVSKKKHEKAQEEIVSTFKLFGTESKEKISKLKPITRSINPIPEVEDPKESIYSSYDPAQLEPEQSKLPSSSKMIESKSQKQDKISQS